MLQLPVKHWDRLDDNFTLDHSLQARKFLNYKKVYDL
jgi:hypothetical protein